MEIVFPVIIVLGKTIKVFICKSTEKHQIYFDVEICEGS